MSIIEKLNKIRQYCGEKLTLGLTEEQIEKFVRLDSRLEKAVEEAYWMHDSLQAERHDILRRSEAEQVEILQQGIVNFYAPETVNPYVALAARGPWIITTGGAVVHDSGGYGMLGLGHGPQRILDTLSQNHVMANVMTASFHHLKLVELLKKEIGHRRDGQKREPYNRFLFMNSGSEAMTVATRIADTRALLLTTKGGQHAGKNVKFLAIKGGFHGRTDRPAQVSDSSLSTYRKYLHSFQQRENLQVIAVNDCEALQTAFDVAEQQGSFFQAMFMEPVMGEGNPGLAVTPEFYALARKLTKEASTLLVVDSIQAGLRAHGCLSICDYPGFENYDPPDMESFSKALNAGQFPLSVLAMREDVGDSYQRGTYGNTMTANPRALDVACRVLESLTPALRANIRDRGNEFLSKAKLLQENFPDVISKVQGTGLLFALDINPDAYKVVGFDGLEMFLRRHGIGVIHGGENCLRFTPTFAITSDEIDLIIDRIRFALHHAPSLKDKAS